MGDDKVLLLRHYRAFYASQAQQLPFELSDEALARWQGYGFPGNVRELRNIVIRLAAKYPGRLVSHAELEDELGYPDGRGPSAWLPPQDIGELSEIALRQLQQRGQFNLEDTLLRWEQACIRGCPRDDARQCRCQSSTGYLRRQSTTLYNRMEVLGT
ncbi:MAG: hypothetical protein M5R42_10250 [Rhodocyclaceae bacterium]|nr:hypothetical protein [Rhodocyclaceae bacterium]